MFIEEKEEKKRKIVWGSQTIKKNLKRQKLLNTIQNYYFKFIKKKYFLSRFKMAKLSSWEQNFLILTI